eukprot:CAMPEP_0168344956 /NCGR_PEP_ID=MMETSP0213-20121227/17202_1 /TAXON_ID=151035 /ORGANISM="Euplotes harpa, Strain FSP1.4" /LENGTH=78 /DNA_ID=CAMNT_0008352951 /DNA_START=757 /DNA_END=989 /DNA_ORIENTATION=+
MTDEDGAVWLILLLGCIRAHDTIPVPLRVVQREGRVLHAYVNPTTIRERARQDGKCTARASIWITQLAKGLRRKANYS